MQHFIQRYSTLSAANEICCYNTFLLVILRLGYQVIGPTFASTYPSLHLLGILDYGPLSPPGLAPDAKTVATEICKSVEYHLLYPARSATDFFLLFPLWLAYPELEPDSKES
jgi:hypothetical protein